MSDLSKWLYFCVFMGGLFIYVVMQAMFCSFLANFHAGVAIANLILTSFTVAFAGISVIWLIYGQDS